MHAVDGTAVAMDAKGPPSFPAARGAYQHMVAPRSAQGTVARPLGGGAFMLG
jgi:hypothetical protein